MTTLSTCPRCGATVPPGERCMCTVADTSPSESAARGASQRVALSASVRAAPPPGGMPPEVQQALLDPRRSFGRFVMLSELGRGGMGVVYKAWDRSLGRHLALKLLPADADAQAVERFRREALAVARVRHPAIVSVHDAGVANGRPYLAMDFIDGAPLDKRLKNEPRLQLARGVEIVREVARALHHAHEEGIVHRDLKPQNILVDGKDRPYVLDFGLAVIKGASSGLTRTGAVLGTPSYMPPEQVDAGGEIDARTDVYALGATLYHVIAGRPPFVGQSEMNVIAAVLTRDPDPPSKFNRRALGDLDTIAARCLEKSPERRYATAAELAAELDRYLAGEPIVARPIGLGARSVRRLRRNPGTSAAVAVALVATTAALAWPRVRAELDARHHAASLARSRAAAGEDASRIAEKIRAKLDAAEARVEAGGEGALAAVASDALASVATIDSESAVRAALRESARAASQGAIDDGEVDAAAEEALAATGRRGLLARASRLAARAYRKRGLVAAATREAARAYRYDPDGKDGAGAFVEVAESLLDRKDWRRALDIFATLASRPIDGSLRARANLGAARSLLAVEELDEARARLALARGSGKLDAASAAVERWASAVADRLAAPLSEPVPDVWTFRRSSPGEGPPDEGLRTEGDEVVFFRIDAKKAGIEEKARAPLAGKGHRAFTTFRNGASTMLAAMTAFDGKATVQLYELDGDRLIPRGEVALPGCHDGWGLVAGDMTGEGHEDLAFVVRQDGEPFERPRPVLLLDPLGKQRLVPLAGFTGVCDGYTINFARLAGLRAPASLLIHSSHWQGFRLHVFDLRGDELVETFRRPLGEPAGMKVVREGEREVALVGGDRERFSDAVPELDVKPDLGADTPDAIWRVFRKDGRVEIEPLYARPFADRMTGSVSLVAPGLVPGYPGAFALVHRGPELKACRAERQVVFVSPLATLPPLFVGLGRERSFDNLQPLPDLDGDGSPEMFVRTERGWCLSGLASLGPAPPPPAIVERPPSETGALDIGLDLLACGEPAEARAQLDVLIARPETSAADRIRARFARARALSLTGDHAEARAALLDLALAEPRWRKEALLLAASAAEEGGSFPEAFRDLERLVASEVLTPEEEVETHRRLRRLGAINSLGERLRVDRDHAFELPFVVERPLQVRRGEHGIVLAGRPAIEGLLRLPLRLIRSDALRIRLRSRVIIGYPSEFHCDIGVPGGGLGFGASCKGGGNISTFERNFFGQDFARFDPDLPVVLESTYVACDGRRLSSLSHGAMRCSGASDFSPIIAGDMAVSFRLGWNDWDGPCEAARVEIEELILEGPPEAIGPDTLEKGLTPEERELAPSLRAFSLGDRASSAPGLVVLADTSTLPGVRKQAAPLAAIALAVAGAEDAAADRFADLLERAPADMEPVFENVGNLEESARVALAKAYRRRFGARTAERAEAVYREQKFGEAVIAIKASRGERTTPELVYAEAKAWAAARDPETALALLDTVDAREARFLAGSCAASLERLDVLLSKWAEFSDDELGPEAAVRRRALRLSKPRER